jgi:hypothetical protein
MKVEVHRVASRRMTVRLISGILGSEIDIYNCKYISEKFCQTSYAYQIIYLLAFNTLFHQPLLFIPDNGSDVGKIGISKRTPQYSMV